MAVIADASSKLWTAQYYVYESYNYRGLLDLSQVVEDTVKGLLITPRELNSYIDVMLKVVKYSKKMRVIDLRGVSYHGGTTLSSGVLPKWDIGDIFIKSCSLSPSGHWYLDAAHEVYAMDLFRGTNIIVADAVPAYVLFNNLETGQEEIRFCEVARKFETEVTYYKDLRKSLDFGRINDEFIDFTDRYKSAVHGILHMLIADYIMNQEDRHSKNFGLLDDGCFSPLYDNGASLRYNIADESLKGISEEIANFKYLSRNPLELVKTYMVWFNDTPNYDHLQILYNLDVIDEKYKGLLSRERLNYNK